MNKILEEYMLVLDNMDNDSKIDYCFTKFYESNNEEKDVLFILIANLITNLPIPLDIKINISEEDKLFIIDSAYKYKYENMNGLKGPLLNTFGEILDNKEPFIKPYLELMRVLIMNQHMKK